MENRRIIKLVTKLGGALISALLITSSPVFAYDQNNTHPALTDEIVDFYNLNFPANKLTEQEKQWLIQGATDEDIGERPLFHFYDPVYNQGIAHFSSKEWALKPSAQANYYNSQLTGFAAISGGDSANDFSYGRALDDYVKGDKERAFIAFGHTLHLLEDAGVPDHTRADPHPPVLDWGSPYEYEMAKWNPINFHISRKLFLTREKPVAFDNMINYFDRIANYSNNNFFSKDTINNQKYQSPDTKNLERIFVNREPRLFIVGKDKNNSVFPLALVSVGKNKELNTIVLVSDEIGSYILDGYWDRLSKDIVLNGAGALNLFLTEAEKAKTEYANKPPEKNWFAKLLGLIGVDTSGLTTLNVVSPHGVDNSNVGDSIVTLAPKVTNQSVSPTPLVTKTPDTNVTKLSPLVSPLKTPAPTPKPSTTPTPLPKPKLSTAKKSGTVVMNEIAWAGTSASATDEWIELYNTESVPVDISSWQLVSSDNSPDIIFPEGTIMGANSYFLIERTDDNTVNDITANLAVNFGQGGVNNTGEMMRLFDSAGIVVDIVGTVEEKWYFGDSTSKNSMERIDPMMAGNSASNWKSFSGTPVNRDASNNLINGTPKAKNSIAVQVIISTGGGGGSSGGSSSSPSPTPTPSVTPTPTPTPDPSPSPTPTPTPGPAEKVNINTASKEQLMTLWGIGDVKSNAIIEYRTTNGPFKKIEDIMNVSGIGPATFAKIKDDITVGDVVLKPSAVTDLVAGHHSPTITATWSAPDSGDINIASLSYDLRYSLTGFPASNSWDLATKVASSSLPNVGEKGAPQSAFFNVAYEYGQTLYFALKTEVIHITTPRVVSPQESDISNISTVNFPTAIDANAWAMLGKDQYHTSFASNLTGPGVGATISWEFDAGAGNTVGQPVVSADGDVYFGSANGTGKLIKLDKNGAKQWEYVTNVSIGMPAVLSDEIIYFGRVGAGGSLAFTALNPDGSGKWDYNDASTVKAVTVSPKGEPYFTYQSGAQDKLAVLKPDGSVKILISGIGLSNFSPVVLDNGTAITAKYVSGNQFFNAYSADGTQFWPDELYYTGANGNIPVNPSHDFATGKTYSAAGPKLFDIPSGGSVLNNHQIDPFGIAATMVAISSDTLYLGFNDFNPASGSRLFAINKSDLTKKWSSSVNSRINSQIAVDKDDNVYFSTENGTLCSVNKDGSQNWKIEAGTASTISPSLTQNGIIWGYGNSLIGVK